MNRTDTSTLSGTRTIALHLLTRTERDGAYADRLLSSRQISELESRDRLFVRELVLGVLRWKLRLDYIIDTYYEKKSKKTLDPAVRNIIRLGLFQMMFMNSVPDRAAVNESVEMASQRFSRSVGGLVNALLRRFSREGEPAVNSSNPVEKLSVEKSYPLWIVKRWADHFGIDTAEAIMTAGNEKHAVSIRVNTTKTDSESLERELKKEGFDIDSSGMPGFFNVRKGSGLFETDAFHEGLFSVQDAASSMAALLAGPEPGEKILDLCSAPGGKATHLAELMSDKGSVDAVDIHAGRIGLVRETAKRLGLESIRCFEGDAVDFGSEENTTYDRVLFDAPCTGTGVFSKRPDMKWRRKKNDIDSIALLQKAIFRNAASRVKPDGILVYSTCSMEPEENENMVTWFLTEYDFTVERDDRFKDFENGDGYLILPHRMHGCGAFAARLRRTQ